MRTKIIRETLFWAHIGIILFALFMGLFFPLWLVVIAASLHRIHTWVFDGCVLSKFERNKGSFGENSDFLRHAARRLFRVELDAAQSKFVDYSFLAISIAIGGMKYAHDQQLIGLAQFVLMLAAVFGMFVASFIYYSDQRSVCSPKGTCSIVLSSRFSEILGVKTSMLGVVFYGFVFVASMASIWANFLVPMMILLAGSGLIASGFFVFVQARLIHAWCKMCLASAVSSAIIFVSVFQV